MRREEVLGSIPEKRQNRVRERENMWSGRRKRRDQRGGKKKHESMRVWLVEIRSLLTHVLFPKMRLDPPPYAVFQVTLSIMYYNEYL